MRDYRLIDADSHTLEPPHIWTSWLPKRCHDRAPKLVKDAEGGDAWLFAPGTKPMEIGLVTTPGRRYEDIRWTGYSYETIRRSCFDPKARLEDMSFDGVDAAFLYPSQRTMHTFMGNPDREFHLAGVRAYKDLKVGERAFTIGSPAGFESTLGEGLVSGLREEEGLHYVQTSAPISPGSSGGGLFDQHGNLIGITTLIYVGEQRINQSLNFAIAGDEFFND